jgi:hypothetical protein
MNPTGAETTSKADQPRLTEANLREEGRPPNLEYRVQRLGTYQDRNSGRQSYGRMKR